MKSIVIQRSLSDHCTVIVIVISIDVIVRRHEWVGNEPLVNYNASL